MTDAILDSEYNDSFELNKTAFNLAINTDRIYFDWMDQPENKDVLKAFSIGMAGFSSISPSTNLLSGKSALYSCQNHASLIPRQDLNGPNFLTTASL